MDLLHTILHMDEYLRTAAQQLGPISYLLLGLVIFAETGLVIAPFLPGDSLLFAAGALAGTGLFSLWLLLPILLEFVQINSLPA